MSNMSFSNYGSASRSPVMNVARPRPSSKNNLTQEILSGVPTPSHLGGENASYTGGNLNNVLYSSRPVERHHNKNLEAYTHPQVYHGSNRPMNIQVALTKAVPRALRGGNVSSSSTMMGGGHKKGHHMGGGHKMGHYGGGHTPSHGGDLVGGDASDTAKNVSQTIANVGSTIAKFLPFIL